GDPGRAVEPAGRAAGGHRAGLAPHADPRRRGVTEVRERPLAIVGPTASGKSSLAMALARRTGAELVSVDSMQVYRGMDIGTAKPTPAERAEVRHHLLDLLDPHEEASVAW